MTIRHYARRGAVADAGISASDNITITGDWTFTGTTVVPEATITAHQAALTITESQISDLGAYLTANETITLSGDATGSGATAIVVTVVDDSHAHTSSTISGLDAGDITTGSFANALISQASVTQHQAAIDHDALTNFVANEHIRWDLTGAEDIHVDRISASAVTQHQASINHDALTNFVANEHINHGSVSIVAGDGMTGGGTIAASRTLNVVGGTGITVAADSVSTNDSQIVHDNLSGFVANEHINHGSVSITAGSGLTGGGTIAASRTINVGAGDGISVAADSVAVDSTVIRTTGNQTLGGRKTFSSPIYLDEQASPGSNVSGDGQIWVSNSSPQTLWFTDDAGSDHHIAGGSLSENFAVVKSADETVTGSTTLQDDNELTLPVIGGLTYLVTARIRMLLTDVDASNPNIKLRWSTPAGSTGEYSLVRRFVGDVNGGTDAQRQEEFAEWGDTNSLIGIDDTVVTHAIYDGVLTAGTSGNLTLQWAQDTHDSVDGTTVLSGSMLMIQQG